ncbi:MAG TPA: sugar phosphate isomerase/epimerase [Candidatus Angelobacter sp.]|nr:sugar phosphate isomerase/epimerase [Candidatus Angelobacter sp.]
MSRNPDRREFLRMAAATTAGFRLSVTNVWGADTSDAKALPIRLGVASYSFRKFGQPDVIRFMKELNTPYLNVKDFHLPMAPAADVKPMSDRYRDAGLTLTAAGTIYFAKDDDADMRAKFEYVKAAEISLIVAGPTPETLPRLESFAKEYNVKIAIHNHGPEDKYFPSPLDALKAVKGMDARMGLCVDVGHTARCGVDVPSAIREAGPRLYDVHMKDLVNQGEKWTQVAVGDGSLPVAKIFAALVAIRYPGFVDLEYQIQEDNPLPGMIKSFAYMRGVLAGMGHEA